MEQIGIIINGIGGILVAVGQWRLGGAIDLWLNALDINVQGIAQSLGQGGNIKIVTGVDEHMKRAVTTNRRVSAIGWGLFALGIVLQVLPHLKK